MIDHWVANWAPQEDDHMRAICTYILLDPHSCREQKIYEDAFSKKVHFFSQLRQQETHFYIIEDA